MADTDIRCHRAWVYSSCSVRLCVIIRVRRSCHTDCRLPLMRAVPGTVWLHESGESGSQSVAPRRFRLNIISPSVLTGDHTQSCTDSCERWHTQPRTLTHGNAVPPRVCMCAWTTTDRSTYRRRRRRRTSTQDTAYAKLYATYRVANGHNCVATATAGYAQGCC